MRIFPCRIDYFGAASWKFVASEAMILPPEAVLEGREAIIFDREAMILNLMTSIQAHEAMILTSYLLLLTTMGVN